MSRSFQDRDFLVWEVFASSGKDGSEDQPNVVFQCMTKPESRPRIVTLDGEEPEAQALVMNATDEELLAMLERSTELP